MSDASSTFASAWEYKGLRLPQLLGPDYGILERDARDRSRQNLLALCEDVKADPANKIALMKEFDRRLPRLSDTAAHLDTFDGAKKAVVLSLVSGGMSKTEAETEANRIPIVDLTQLAMKVSTLNRLYKTDPSDPPTAGTAVVEGNDEGKKPPASP